MSNRVKHIVFVSIELSRKIALRIPNNAVHESVARLCLAAGVGDGGDSPKDVAVGGRGISCILISQHDGIAVAVHDFGQAASGRPSHHEDFNRVSTQWMAPFPRPKQITIRA